MIYLKKFVLSAEDPLIGEKNGNLIGIKLNIVLRNVLDQINLIEILLIF